MDGFQRPAPLVEVQGAKPLGGSGQRPAFINSPRSLDFALAKPPVQAHLTALMKVVRPWTANMTRARGAHRM